MLDLNKLEQQFDDDLENTPEEWWDNFVKQAEENRKNAGSVDFSEEYKTMEKIMAKSTIPSGFTINIFPNDLVEQGTAIFFLHPKDYDQYIKNKTNGSI